jgi:hypothetical protein
LLETVRIEIYKSIENLDLPLRRIKVPCDVGGENLSEPPFSNRPVLDLAAKCRQPDN